MLHKISKKEVYLIVLTLANNITSERSKDAVGMFCSSWNIVWIRLQTTLLKMSHLSLQCKVLVQSNCVGCDQEIDTDAFSSFQGFILEFCR